MLQVSTPDQLLRVPHSATFQAIIRIQAQRTQEALEGCAFRLTQEEFLETLSTLREFTGIKEIRTNDVHHLTAIYPYLKGLIRNSGIDTEVRELILACFSVMLVGTPFKDTPEFRAMLHQAYPVYLQALQG